MNEKEALIALASFVPFGPTTSSLSAAPRFLIARGAKLITSTKDLLEEIRA